MLINGGVGSFDTTHLALLFNRYANFHTSQKPVSQIKYGYNSIVWTAKNMVDFTLFIGHEGP